MPPRAPVGSGSVRLLDVSDLPPPEPFERAVEALDALAPGEALHFRHRREPRLLFPLLEGRGYRQVTVATREGEVHVVIWEGGDEAAEAAAHAVVSSLSPPRRP